MIVHGDCLDELRRMPDASCDSLVTDPPAGIGFMGKAWDGDKGGRAQWVAWMASVMTEVMRVLKPGAHGLVWALPRTSHWTATALEDAGFEVRDVITHHFGTGFPKSLDVSKAIDRAAGAERTEKIRQKHQGVIDNSGINEGWQRPWRDDPEKLERSKWEFAPVTDAARQWSGWGTALKPASEHWILIRKPCSEKTVAANVLEHGTGAINVDGCRIAGAVPQTTQGKSDSVYGGGNGLAPNGLQESNPSPLGRWPANVVLSHSEECECVGTRKVKAITGGKAPVKETERAFGGGRDKVFTDRADADGTETVEAWNCAPDCAVKALDGQSGALKHGGNTQFKGRGAFLSKETTERKHYAESGGASRFFYCAKASKSDRGAGNTHSTVKSTKLMQYLIRLVTPPNGVVLDPFCGSGSTGVAAKREGFGFIGIEREAEYVEIARKRLES